MAFLDNGRFRSVMAVVLLGGLVLLLTACAHSVTRDDAAAHQEAHLHPPGSSLVGQLGGSDLHHLGGTTDAAHAGGIWTVRASSQLDRKSVV